MKTISLRVDRELEEEIDFVKAALDTTQTQVIKEAIHAFYLYLQNQEKLKKSPKEIFKSSGYIGSFEGKKDLSVNYKKELARGLKAKHGIK